MKYLWNIYFFHKKGQLAVEYVLLLLVTLSICLALLSFFEVGETDQEGSSLVLLYRELIRFIGKDLN